MLRMKELCEIAESGSLDTEGWDDSEAAVLCLVGVRKIYSRHD